MRMRPLQPLDTLIGILIGLAFAWLTGCSFTPGDNSGPDSTVETDASIDASIDASTRTTLTQAISSTVQIGHAVFCNSGAATTRDNAWFRTFRPVDFGIATTFHIDHVHFTAESSNGATAVKVTVSAYTGVIDGTTLDMNSTELVSISGAVPNSASPQDLTTVIAADIVPSGAFVVEVSATDTFSGGTPVAWFHAGANSLGQSARSYFASAACGAGTPTSQANFDVIISVEGTF